MKIHAWCRIHKWDDTSVYILVEGWKRVLGDGASKSGYGSSSKDALKEGVCVLLLNSDHPNKVIWIKVLNYFFKKKRKGERWDLKRLVMLRLVFWSHFVDISWGFFLYNTLLTSFWHIPYINTTYKDLYNAGYVDAYNK
jgi:hypothetical protein